MIPFNYPNDPVEGFEHLELGFPWIVVESAEKLNEELKETDIVLEFGSGGSTIFFAERCKLVKSVETSKEWYDEVLHKIVSKGIANVPYKLFEKEEEINGYAAMGIHKEVSVISVDTQGGYNRSAILNAFLENGVSENLRMIVLDNYGHEGLFPDHYDKENFMGDDWEVFTYNHERWAGFGTRIYIKKQKV